MVAAAGLVVLLVALWQGRRIGPLVAEDLPVVVRASETVEGRGQAVPVAARTRSGRRRLANRHAAAHAAPARPRHAIGSRRGGTGRRAPRRPAIRHSSSTGCTARPRPPTPNSSNSPANWTTSKGRSHDLESANRTPPTVDPDTARSALLDLRTEIAKAVVGQDAVVSGLVIALLCRGHVLLEGVPGVAKTLLIRTLAAALQLDFKRVQFTPDLMPGDITGSLVYDARTAEFAFRSGPVFTNLLLADEINRTPPKTQAALLGGHGGTAGQRGRRAAPAARPVHRRRHAEPHRIRRHVPTSRGSTRPVPAQAQRAAAAARPGDRDPGAARPRVRPARPLGHPTRRGPRRTRGGRGRRCSRCWWPTRCSATSSTSSGRPDIRPSLQLGVSPRGATALLSTARSWAWLSGRNYVTPDDVKAMARPTLRHRVALRPEAELEGANPDGVLDGDPGRRTGAALVVAHRPRVAGGIAVRAAGRLLTLARNGVHRAGAVACCGHRASTSRWPPTPAAALQQARRQGGTARRAGGRAAGDRASWQRAGSAARCATRGHRRRARNPAHIR